MSFEVAAERYDAFMGRWSRLLAPAFADFAGVGTATRVLDVGCGTGMLTGELVRRVGPAFAAAVDPSTPFIAAMRERYPDVDVQEAGADDLPYPDDAFDAALAQLVVHFLPNPVAGLREMRRVTRPGGCVTACVWDHAGDRGPLAPFWAAARAIDPEVDDESGRAGTREGHLAELLDAAGMTRIEAAPLTVTLRLPDFDAWWTPFTYGVGPAGGFVGSLDEARREELRERCRDALPDGPLELSAVAWSARGRT